MKYSKTAFSVQAEQEAQQALLGFLTPLRQQPSESEQALFAKATILSIPFNALNINAFLWGNGRTILLVHGWGGYGLQLSEFVNPLLNAGYRVLAFDAPAHGSTPGEQTNFFELAQAIATVAQYQSPIEGIIAHSFGAASTTLALCNGLQTGKVVYLGAVGCLSNAATTFAKRVRLSGETTAAFRYLCEEKFGQDIWQKFTIDQTARHLSIPVTLFHDRRDREVPFSESLAISQIWSGANLIETVGLGHRRIMRDESVIRQAVEFMTSS
jgi:pimeloyl-ACP methyl ester carboxylesterase